MDRYSIIDPGFSPTKVGILPPTTAPIEETGSQKAAPPAASLFHARPHEVQGQLKANPALPESTRFRLRFPGEDGGKSLAELALRDLDATLQLLAERAQYITGATGAAIAVHQGEEMVCRASAGSSAPEMGAHLQLNSGLSGESVRTRQMLRCDDAETDPRVNRESCRALGIASVVVMPLCRDHEVRGVFELFSDRPHAFNERDLAALERMGEMAHIALDHADAVGVNADALPPSGENLPQVQFSAEPIQRTSGQEVSGERVSLPDLESRDEPAGPVSTNAAQTETSVAEGTESSSITSVAIGNELNGIGVQNPAVKTGATPPQTGASPEAATQAVDVPVETPGMQSELAHIGKCEKCGFPVSGGRNLCLDCEPRLYRQESVFPKQGLPNDAPGEFVPNFLSGGPAATARDTGWHTKTKYIIAALVPTVVLLLAWFLSRA